MNRFMRVLMNSTYGLNKNSLYCDTDSIHEIFTHEQIGGRISLETFNKLQDFKQELVQKEFEKNLKKIEIWLERTELLKPFVSDEKLGF